MAKPIRATPELKGESADIFLKKMISVERTRISKKDQELSNQIKENLEFFNVC